MSAQPSRRAWAARWRGPDGRWRFGGVAPAVAGGDCVRVSPARSCGGGRAEESAARGGGRGGLVRCCAPVLRDRSLAFRDNVRVRVRAVLLARLLACSDFLHGHAPPGCRLLPARRSIPRRVPALRTQATKARRVWRVRDDGRQAQPARRRRERTCPLLPCPTPTRCMLSSRDGCPVDTP